MSDAQAVIARSMSEKALSDNIVSLARMLGWLVHRDPTWRATGADAGYPDLTLARAGDEYRYAIMRGRKPLLIFAELKAENGRMQAAQTAWRERLEDVAYESVERENVAYYVWRPSDWLDGTIEKVLR